MSVLEISGMIMNRVSICFTLCKYCIQKCKHYHYHYQAWFMVGRGGFCLVGQFFCAFFGFVYLFVGCGLFNLFILLFMLLFRYLLFTLFYGLHHSDLLVTSKLKSYQIFSVGTIKGVCIVRCLLAQPTSVLWIDAVNMNK